jgi:hypothetical protein
MHLPNHDLNLYIYALNMYMTKFIHIGSSKIKLGFQDVSPQRVRRKNVWNLTATNGKANRYSHKDQLILTQA